MLHFEFMDKSNPFVYCGNDEEKELKKWLRNYRIARNDGNGFYLLAEKQETLFEIRELDCYLYDEEWTQNTSYFVGNMVTKAENEKRAFTKWLKKKGISFKLNRTLIEYDGDCYTIIDRKTKEPLYIAIPACN